MLVFHCIVQKPGQHSIAQYSHALLLCQYGIVLYCQDRVMRLMTMTRENSTVQTVCCVEKEEKKVQDRIIISTKCYLCSTVVFHCSVSLYIKESVQCNIHSTASIEKRQRGRASGPSFTVFRVIDNLSDALLTDNVKNAPCL